MVAATVVVAAVVVSALVVAAVVAAAVVGAAVVAAAVVAALVVVAVVVAATVVAAVVVAAAVVAAAVVAAAVVVGLTVVAPVVVAPAVVAPAAVVGAAVVAFEQELLAGTGTLGSLQLQVRSVWTARYANEVHRAWLYLVRGTPRSPWSLPYNSLPQAMVVEVMLLHMTVCTFPVDCTVVKQLRNLSSGQRQITSVEDPKTGVGAAAVAAPGAGGDPGLHSPFFFVIVVISITPGTGWQKREL